uniref:Na_H_Exchanger domain-containing protein n=1 Tax=Elaeophora elaphi TaxID=1147741 RepID=A0A0R3RUZ5_9BILA
MPRSERVDETKTILSAVDLHVNSALSIFILRLAAFPVESLFTLCRLPNIIGVLLIGIALRNIPFMNNILYIDHVWKVLVMRAGMGLDTGILRRTEITVFRLGIISTVCEGGIIILVTYFIFGVSTEMSILFGTILSATSPTVTISAILDLSKKGHGAGSGLPTAVLASYAIDNVVYIVAYTIAAALVFTTVKLTSEIAMTFTTIVISLVAGIPGGRILCVFPHESLHHRHFIRGTLLLSVCLALKFGIPGCDVISTVLLSMVAAIKWEEINAKFKEAEALALMWNFLPCKLRSAWL